MYRLNNGIFLKFFLCLDIFFLTFSLERTHLKSRKIFFRIFLIFRVYFGLFRDFSYKTFLYSEKQSRVYHHKMPRKIPRWTLYVWSQGSTGKVVLYQKLSKNVILRGQSPDSILILVHTSGTHVDSTCRQYRLLIPATCHRNLESTGINY